MFRNRFDLAIVGSGFAGSLLAMIARRLGQSVVLLEKQSHPRIVIGESSTPLANLLLEELAERYELPQLRPFCKWGSWQRTHPEVACGLKRGFTFYGHDLGHPEPVLHNRQKQLLVAASPADEIADTHWYRADVDWRLLTEARACGAAYIDKLHLQAPALNKDGVQLTGQRDGERIEIDAGFLLDASGPRGFLWRSLQLGERELPSYPRTEALYSHFTGVTRLNDARSNLPGSPPYPADDAAVHHIFDGGWIWVLRFNNGVTSAGVAATTELAARYRLQDGASAWARLLSDIPELQRQFASAQPLYDFVYLPNLPFWSSQVAGRAGEQWALLPSAAGFVDPLLSTGFPLTLFGIERIARLIATGKLTNARAWETYAEETDRDLLATAHLTAALYRSMGNFDTFQSRTMLYFAAASYSECARRLGKPELAPGFLLRDHPEFGKSIQELAVQPAGPRLAPAIGQGIQPFNIAGLSDPRKCNWYPASAEDLLNSAGKLQATEAEIVAMLKRCGFEPAGEAAGAAEPAATYSGS